MLKHKKRRIREITDMPFLLCALRRTFLTGESPKSALVVGRI